MNATNAPYGGGWQCAKCNAIVPNGTLHMCTASNTHPAVTTWTTSSPYVDPTQARIAAALERVASALEALVEQSA